MTTWLLIGAILVALLLVGARFLFRQRDPEEIRSARERLRAFKRKP
jgi:hypothetical protein